MHVTARSLWSLTAADLMTNTVVTIPQHSTLGDAARLLAHHAISGAPVVDREGKCVGVLSTADFLSWIQKGTGRPRGRSDSDVCAYSAWQMLEKKPEAEDEVCRFMTSDPVTVPPTMRIGELARRMLDAHIHRVVITDDEGRPAGIVSSTDLLAALAYSEQRPAADVVW